ncbi:MAG: nitronate monooxygenase family protein [Caldisericia bacterium]|jgi:NAD(P)H-dependent flavin oxidoreductase YrpB (nitropropane dioxygenase family)|nr:nitronate monooxygenase [Caldisericia bacterium]MDD5688702.1 nitronate monooxygenase family protein [Caldisericia bacterium]HXK70968.1 nitronate monooxygenase family protein [Caldisericia bacterium]
MNLKMPKLVIGDLDVKVPIIQGGMGVGISLAGLASAVANEGAIGVISSAGIGMLEPDFRTNFKEANRRALKNEIRKARKMTDGIIGVNIMVALSDFNDLVLTALEEMVDIIFFGAGITLNNLKTLAEGKIEKITTKFVPIISSGKSARIIFQWWSRHYNYVPDAVVVEGPLAGGHLGFTREQINNPNYALEKLLLDVISIIIPFEDQYSKKIPVIAAGGVYTGEDIYKLINLGADGVQMATRFVTTFECDASDEFKEAYINCNKDDIVIIESPVGMPGRAIRNRFIEDISLGIKKPFKCPWKCLKTCDFTKSKYCIALALTNAKLGNLDEGFVFAGANAYLSNKIISVKKLIEELSEEYKIAALNDSKLSNARL